MSKRFLLLDRDGTLIVDKDYLSDPDQVEFFEGVPEALRVLRNQGWGIIVVTNQSGITRGLFTIAEVKAVHARIEAMLIPYGASIDAFYICPHLPDEGCTCRKPNPGMALQAAEDFGFDPGDAVVVGDKESDLELGRNIGAKTVLVRTGKSAGREGGLSIMADVVINSLADLPSATIALGLPAD